MSLFKVRELWKSHGVAEDDLYDIGSLAIGNINSSSGTTDVIVLSNFSGNLKVYEPSFSCEDESDSGYKSKDLLLDVQLSDPILQIALGNFVSGMDNHHLCVLHPRRLAVYSILANRSNSVDLGSQYSINLVYEHHLQRSSFQFCFGPFGRVTGKDFICVQSLDCTLMVIEQETVSFSQTLPNSLLPGPLRYISNTDSFITVSSNRYMESYRYETLAVGIDAEMDKRKMKSSKKILSDWCVNLGEEVVAMEIECSVILALGERTIFGINDSGHMMFTKKLDYTALCFCSYRLVDGNVIDYIVCSDTCNILVYSNTKLMWTAKMNHSPVQISVANIRNLQGTIVSVSDVGQIECSSLRMQPTVQHVVAPQSHELPYSSMDEEMALLQNKIKNLSNKSFPSHTTEVRDELKISHKESVRFIDPETANLETEIKIDENLPLLPVCDVKVSLKSRILLENVSLCVTVSWPLVCQSSVYRIESLNPSTPQIVDLLIYQKYLSLITELKGYIKAQYYTSTGSPRIVTSDIFLPLKLVVYPSVSSNTAVHKITFDTKTEPIKLNELFPDILADSGDSAGNSLCLHYIGGSDVSVLISKTSYRYRVQSDQFECLWLLLSELLKRLKKHFSQLGQADFKAIFSGNYPFKEVFDIIDGHFECRQALEDLHECLAQSASEFRVIQRRLLTKMKDKTLSTLSHLDTLLEGNYHQILLLAEGIKDKQHLERTLMNKVNAAMHVLIIVIGLHLDLPEEEIDILHKILKPSVSCHCEQGWEEIAQASVTHVLRTSLAKSSKDHIINPAPLSFPTDLGNLKKQIMLLCDKLEKGGRLTDQYDVETKKKASGDNYGFYAKASDINFDSHQNEQNSGDVVNRSPNKSSRDTQHPLSNKSSGLTPLPTEDNDLYVVDESSELISKKTYSKTSHTVNEDERRAGERNLLVPDLDEMDSLVEYSC